MSSNVPYTEILDAYIEFNPAIRSHIAYADSRPEVRAALTETTRKAFLEIIRRANIENAEQPIWIRVDRTADRLGVCGRTVSRTIKMMRAKGWLVPSATHDGRNNQGEFDGREYLLTPAMRQLMRLPQKTNFEANGGQSNSGGQGAGLAPTTTTHVPQLDVLPKAHQLPVQQLPTSPQAPVQAAALPAGSPLSKALAIAQRRAAEELAKRPPADEKPSEQADLSRAEAPVENSVDNAVLPCPADEQNDVNPTGLSSGVIYEVNKVFVLKEAPLYKGGLFLNTETGKTIRLPFDLLPLVNELGIRPDGVCKLMRIAGSKGHRLQDVWAVKREQFLASGAREGRAVKYFEFLLNCGDDFAYRASVKTAAGDPHTADAGKPALTSDSGPSRAPQKPAVAAEQATNTALASLLAIAKATRFKRFRHVRNGMLVRFFDGIAEVTYGMQRSFVAGWDKLEAYYLGVSRGNLIEVTE